jgi:uncharacterized membrane protein YeaQ/YmgE (transglycosylase-associated protein family)
VSRRRRLTRADTTPPSLRRVGDWLFRSRTTGAITVAQVPSPLLVGFLVVTLARWVLPLSGRVHDVVGDVALALLAGWSLDEIIRGVNPWRRILGTIVGAIVAMMLVHRAR